MQVALFLFIVYSHELLSRFFFEKRRRKEKAIKKKRRGFVSPSADGDKGSAPLTAEAF